MNNYEKMKLAEKYDEDFLDDDETNTVEAAEKFESSADKFKRKYKEFYSDIKLSHREDW